MADPDHQKPESASSSSFEALKAPSAPKEPPRRAPNPLRSADPERLKAAREDVERIIAARRHGLANS